MKRSMLFAAAALMLAGMAGQSSAQSYRYETTENFCPPGFAPAYDGAAGGVFCCANPSALSYQQVMAHATPRRAHKPRRVHRTRTYHCPVGQKGCR